MKHIYVDRAGDQTPAEALRNPDPEAVYWLPPGCPWSLILYQELKKRGCEVHWVIETRITRGDLELPPRPPWIYLEEIRLLTRGGMSEIYTAVDEQGTEKVIKIYPRAMIRRAGYPEPRLAKKNIPGLFPIENWAVTEKYIYLLMPRARAVAYPGMGSIVPCLDSIAHTLSELHARGWVHCDIKPGNIFCYQNQWYLADPGIAIPLGQILPRPRCSLRYAPPEWINALMKNQPVRILPSADVYAFALTFIYLFTGTHPIPEDDPGLVYSMYESGKMNQRLKAIIERHDFPFPGLLESAVDPDPGNRPSIMVFKEAFTQKRLIR